VHRTSTDRMVSNRHQIITVIEDCTVMAATNIRLSIITQDPMATVMVAAMSSSRYGHTATIQNLTIMSSTGGHWARIKRRRMRNQRRSKILENNDQ